MRGVCFLEVYLLHNCGVSLFVLHVIVSSIPVSVFAESVQMNPSFIVMLHLLYTPKLVYYTCTLYYYILYVLLSS